MSFIANKHEVADRTKRKTIIYSLMSILALRTIIIKAIFPIHVSNYLERRSVKCRVISLFLIGLSCFLASPPLFYFPILIVGFSSLIYLIDLEEFWLHRFYLIMAFVSGYFLGNLYWFSIAMTVDLKQYFWFIPINLILVPIIYGIHGSIIMIPFILCSRKIANPFYKYTMFCLSWFIFERSRGIMPFGGTPWQTIGTIFAMTDASLQIGRWIKIEGLDMITIFIASSGYLVSKNLEYRKMILLFWIFCTTLIIIFGYTRLAMNKTQYDCNRMIIGVQGNISQHHVMDKRYYRDIIMRHYELTEKALHGISDALIVWPEAIVPFYNSSISGNFGNSIMGILKNNHLFFGTSYHDGHRFWNTAILLNENGIVDMYHKRHLVPFGEYVPFRSFLPKWRWLESIVGGDDIGFGQESHTFNIPGFVIAPSICYESAFSHDIIPSNSYDVNILINITNDGWFGRSLGPYQHFTIAKIRAVENGLPLLRVANTGISALFDKYGRVVRYIGLNRHGVIISGMPL